MKDSQILQVVGFSKTGKTLVISELIEKLTEKHVKILTLKSARQHKYDFSKKDSDVFSQKGSSLSVVAFKNITQVSIGEDIDIMEFTKNLADSFNVDLVLIEGFKEEKFTKLVIWSEEILEKIKTFNFEGIKYLLCSQENLRKYRDDINKINDRYNFNIIEELEVLIDKIIQDYNF